MTRLAIEIDGVGKMHSSRRGEPIEALRGVDLGVGEGEFVALVGPSGCGKSTLLRIVAGLAAPTSGWVAVGGAPVTGPRPDVGLVFQRPALLPWRTVRKNVLLPAEVLGLDRRAAMARASELLELVGLGGFEDALPAELSGGMQGRVAIARSLLQDPAILLMDEPFAALDALTREDLARELLGIWDRLRKTVLFVTHAIPEAVFLADRVAVMTPRPGHIAGIVPVELPRPRHPSVVDTAGFGAIAARVRVLLDTGAGLPPVFPAIEGRR
ncbi:MAG: ABC transporter ATP-binding protein [Chloroflexota bacterium]|nr:ABC transporter ATP-binding protein [Chloroflexota bacterium]